MTATVSVEAESLIEAVEIVDNMPLPEDGEYMGGSFEVNHDALAFEYEDEPSQ